MRLVEGVTHAPPYPAATTVAGSRFPINSARLEQGEGWIVAPLEMRPWLLMLWWRGWMNQPAGSFPDKDNVIAAQIGMPLNAFQMNRDTLMHGFYRASDGRLYHNVLVELVLEKLAHREAWCKRHGVKKPPGAAQELPKSPESHQALTAVHRGGTLHGGDYDYGGGVSTTPKVKSSMPPRKPRRPIKRPCPEGFCISDRVKAWAAKHGSHDLPLDAHFKFFMSFVRRSAPVYADWDEGLMNCIRNNWLGVELAKQEGAKRGGKRFETGIDQTERIAAGLTGRKPGRTLEPD